MTISVTCHHCRRSYQVPTEFAGRRFRCRNCGDEVSIPEAPSAEPDEKAASDADAVPLMEEPAQLPAPVPLPAVVPNLTRSRRERNRDQMPSTILLALVFGGLHMIEDLLLVISGFSVAGDAPQTAGPIILAGLIRLGIELSIFTGLLRRRALARIASLILTSLGLGVQILVLLTMSWVALVGPTLPDIDPEELGIVAAVMTACSGIGIFLRIGGIAALAPESAARWCDVPSNPGT